MNAIYSLPHPSIVHLLAISTGGGVKALVYEYCPKGSVESLLLKCECLSAPVHSGRMTNSLEITRDVVVAVRACASKKNSTRHCPRECIGSLLLKFECTRSRTGAHSKDS